VYLVIVVESDQDAVSVLLGGRPWSEHTVGIVGCIADITMTSVAGIYQTAESAASSHHVTRCRRQVQQWRRIRGTQVIGNNNNLQSSTADLSECEHFDDFKQRPHASGTVSLVDSSINCIETAYLIASWFVGTRTTVIQSYITL